MRFPKSSRGGPRRTKLFPQLFALRLIDQETGHAHRSSHENHLRRNDRSLFRAVKRNPSPGANAYLERRVQIMRRRRGIVAVVRGACNGGSLEGRVGGPLPVVLAGVKDEVRILPRPVHGVGNQVAVFVLPQDAQAGRSPSPANGDAVAVLLRQKRGLGESGPAIGAGRALRTWGSSADTVPDSSVSSSL